MDFRFWLENLECDFNKHEKVYLNGIFYKLVHNEKSGWNFQPNNYYYELLERAKKCFNYVGEVYRTISIPIKTLQSWNLADLPTLQSWQKEPKNFKRKDEIALDELKKYVLKMADSWSRANNSWSKSLKGVNYFKVNQPTKAYNVVLKAWMSNGLDLYKFGEFVGADKNSKEMRITLGAEEVVGHPEKIEILKIHLLKNPKPTPKPNPYDLI
jgi:hypothetical protein